MSDTPGDKLGDAERHACDEAIFVSARHVGIPGEAIDRFRRTLEMAGYAITPRSAGTASTRPPHIDRYYFGGADQKHLVLVDSQDSMIYTLDELNALLATRSASGASLKDDVPLQCEVVDGAIQFVIGTQVLAHATNICPTLYDPANDRGRYRVTDHAVFAAAVAHELNHEDETGNTPLTKVLDEAVAEAINQGAEGVEENVTNSTADRNVTP